MFPYFFLIFIPLIFTLVSLNKNENGLSTLSLGLGEKNNKGNLALWIFFFLFFLLLALRKETIGTDLVAYNYLFIRISGYNFSQLFENGEPIYYLITWITGKITSDFQIYLVVTSFISLIPIAYVYNKDRGNGYFKLIIFVNMSTFVMLFSGIRQSMAMGIGMLAYYCIKNKKIAPFLIWATIASLIHHSGFMIFAMYPIYHFKLNKNNMFILTPVIALVYVFNQPIFSLLMKITGQVSDKYDSKIGDTGAYGSLILFLLFFVFAFIISDENKMGAESLGLRNFLLVTLIIQFFAPLHSLAMRMNYYFILFVPLALADAIKNSKDEYRQIAALGEAVMSIFFTILFVYTTYNSYKTGESALETIPYEFFWQ
ncbi:MAG: EpsG family protein [Oscillospiraceae bacterium]|nr:EpsG family protein [Oscillospiraceae bacterium]